MNIELLSIDLSNYCSKECPFCYNHSKRKGNTLWTPDEVISFATDCIDHGVKAISLGGGEPFEYDGIFRIIDAIQPIAYLSITTNGLPLADDETWNELTRHLPDKIHITIHNPDDDNEIQHVMKLLGKLQQTSVTAGVNLLADSQKLTHCRATYKELRNLLSQQQIIIVPMRFSNTPTPKSLTFITDGEIFQAPSCILKCGKPDNFCSVSWDKKVNFCSYAGGKQALNELTYNAMIQALTKVDFKTCTKPHT